MIAGRELSLEKHHKRQDEDQTQFAPRKHIDICRKIGDEPILGNTTNAIII